ncbi:uncharacterized protein cd79b [Toxotes jaculatrix]|uniref:uncharacterized protein cd79b n=1 Tax=Toxotes jaculatrix TaxID=941984 RepID=UPI001B3AA3DC|nr:uncharacterized protein cd79b [Toxotes jaculatrix]
MGWLLAGCCWLALINLSATLTLRITQKPRYYGVKTKSTVGIYCSIKQNQQANVTWYKAKEYNTEKTEVSGEKFGYRDRNSTTNAFLYIHDVRVDDSGVYFCKINNIMGPGTQLIAVNPVDYSKIQYRTNMKDGLIVFQGLLLAVCIAAILLRKQSLWEQEDSMYEEPETDHIYEGLAIETCGGGLYEELSVYAQAEGAEAPWE